MRTHKYRGQRCDNKEWAPGYLFGTWERRYILWGTTNGAPNMVEVIPETVGEFTGLTDKNGKEIYEGDILKDANGDLYTCEWCIDKWLFSTKNCKSPQWMTWALKDMTIIGNIWEVDS